MRYYKVVGELQREITKDEAMNIISKDIIARRADQDLDTEKVIQCLFCKIIIKP